MAIDYADPDYYLNRSDILSNVDLKTLCYSSLYLPTYLFL